MIKAQIKEPKQEFSFSDLLTKTEQSMISRGDRRMGLSLNQDYQEDNTLHSRINVSTNEGSIDDDPRNQRE